MGSKQLKAIAITSRKHVQLHDPEAFKTLVREQVRLMKASKGFHHHTDVGTTTTHDITQSARHVSCQEFPIRTAG